VTLKRLGLCRLSISRWDGNGDKLVAQEKAWPGLAQSFDLEGPLLQHDLPQPKQRYYNWCSSNQADKWEHAAHSTTLIAPSFRRYAERDTAHLNSRQT